MPAAQPEGSGVARPPGLLPDQGSATVGAPGRTGARRAEPRVDPLPPLCLSTSHFGVVLTGVEVELRRRGLRGVRNLPVRPLHELPDPLHNDGQETATTTGALRFPQLQTARLAGCPQEAGPAGRTSAANGQRPPSWTAPSTTSSPLTQNRIWAAHLGPGGNTLISKRSNIRPTLRGCVEVRARPSRHPPHPGGSSADPAAAPTATPASTG